MAFHRSLSDSRSAHVSRTLLSILAHLNNAVVWIVSTRPLIFKFSSPYMNPLVTVPSTLTITDIIFMFCSFFFSSQARFKYLSFFSLSFNFTLWSAETAKSIIQRLLFIILFFFQRICIYHLFVWSNLNVLHNSWLISFPTQLYLIKYSFVLIYCIQLICDRSFRLYHQITCICFVASYLFWLWYYKSWWHYFVFLFEEIQFLS